MANDASKTPGSEGDPYPISASVINAIGALDIHGHTFTAHNFISPQSGKKYQWMGWAVGSESSPLDTTNPLTLSALSGTLRSYWNTVDVLPQGDVAGDVGPTDTASYNGAFVAGAEANDNGWLTYADIGGMDVRAVANDAGKTPGCVGNPYSIATSVINDTGALEIRGHTFTAHNFTSPQSGKKYRWMGWAVGSASSPLDTTNPLTVSVLSGTLRSYWATVK